MYTMTYILFILQALAEIVSKVQVALPSTKGRGRSGGVAVPVKASSAITGNDGSVIKKSEEKPFDSMNNIVANMMLNMTR